ncbi:putative polygalacturonase [Lupinus albus]|uniref:Putative polygalacturonase n=1 Tax=Lupinus albus TaxID=3870 RepID=A0A6A4QQ07_LUPAL|nr:putative polygalacturonase [Lupinus albus]
MQGLVVTFFIISFASFCSCNRILKHNPKTTIFSVMDYGAVGDGVTDDSKAFGKAWGDACEKSDSIGTIEVPQGKTFMLKPLKFTGPCKFSSINFKVEGNIVAPSSTDAWTNDDDKSKWLEFVSIYGLIFNGGGQINGHGSVWWESCHALSFNKCNNLQLSDTQHLDSAKGNISISGSNNVKVSNLTITAPQDSKNTDGIDISDSNYVVIDHSTIATGDDCIALGSGTSNINITNITCGPGHGIRYIQNTLLSVRFHKIDEIIHRKNIYHFLSLFCCDHVFSIGSLGRGGVYATVENGSGLEISGVTYKDVKGTSASEIAINLDCNSSEGCHDIIMDDINLTSHTSSSQATASCINANGEGISVSPKVPCLAKKTPTPY